MLTGMYGAPARARPSRPCRAARGSGVHPLQLSDRLCCTNVCTAVRNAHRDPGQHQRGGAAAPAAAPEHVGEPDPAQRTGERRKRHANSRPATVPGENDHDGGAEPGPGRRAEQVRVGERVAEHALVCRAGNGERAADRAPSTTLGSRSCNSRMPPPGSAPSGADERQPAQISRTPLAERDRSPRQSGRAPRRRQAGRTPRPGPRRSPVRPSASRPRGRPPTGGLPCGLELFPCRRRHGGPDRVTMRGSQRDAMSSLSGTTSPSFTAVQGCPAGPGGDRARGLAAAVVSASKIRSGSADDVLRGQLRIAAAAGCRPGRRCSSGRTGQSGPMKSATSPCIGLVELVVVAQRLGRFRVPRNGGVDRRRVRRRPCWPRPRGGSPPPALPQPVRGADRVRRVHQQHRDVQGLSSTGHQAVAVVGGGPPGPGCPWRWASTLGLVASRLAVRGVGRVVGVLVHPRPPGCPRRSRTAPRCRSGPATRSAWAWPAR